MSSSAIIGVRPERNTRRTVEECVDMFAGESLTRLRFRGAPALLVFGCVVATLLVFATPSLGQDSGGSDGGASFKDLATGVGAAVGAVLALLGAPGVYLGIKKSQAEIRKLELETEKLRAEQGDASTATPAVPGQTYSVVVEGRDNTVSILADPRLLGPLLLLLDFVIATIVLTITGYLLSFGGLSVFSPILALIAIALFIPIYREARRLKRALDPETGDDSPNPSLPDERGTSREAAPSE